MTEKRIRNKKKKVANACPAVPEPQPVTSVPSDSSPETEVPKQAPVEITPIQVLQDMSAGLGVEASDDHKKRMKSAIQKYIGQTIDKYEISGKYNVVIFYDETQMVQSDADSIYSAVTGFAEAKPILLVLHSSGGYVGSAYLIGKLLHEYSKGQLDIVVPRRAKSAATLLCCAADRIHMGSLTELGPIDPQFEGLPALGLKSAIEHIAALVREYPHASDLLAEYMSKSIPPIYLGYYERVAESAAQYAERLLQFHQKELPKPPQKIAKDLVYSYKDHSFVIDKQEAQTIFGSNVVKHNTPEYEFGNAVYQALIFVRRVAEIYDHEFFFIGSACSDPGLIKKRK
jgi:ClpP class serine protease